MRTFRKIGQASVERSGVAPLPPKFEIMYGEGQKMKERFWPFNFLYFWNCLYISLVILAFFPQKIKLRDLKIQNPEVETCLGTNVGANPTKC